MRLPDNTSTLDSDFSSTGYSIGDRAMMEAAFSTMMYKNPHLAVTREILANARDAHRELGIPWVAPLITLPEPGHANLVIEDFGPGISKARMIQHFSSYCASTKRGDNTQTGGFGMGCKTPFAISKSFMVDTTSYDEDGVKRRRLWSHHKDAQGLSAFSQVLEQETSNPTGTLITIPCPSIDAHKLDRALREVTAWWEVPPVRMNPEGEVHFVQVTPLQSTPICNGNDTIHHHGGSSHLVVVDGIPYETPSSWKIRCQKKLVFFFGTGEVPVTLTRDNLDAEAEEIVMNRYARFLVDVVENVPSLADAIRLSETFCTQIPYSENGVVVFNGDLTVTVPDHYRVHRIFPHQRESTMSHQRRKTIDLTAVAEGERFLLWDGQKEGKVNLEWAKSWAKYNGKDKRTYLIRPFRIRDRDLAFENLVRPFSIYTHTETGYTKPAPAPRRKPIRHWMFGRSADRLIPVLDPTETVEDLPKTACYAVRRGHGYSVSDIGGGKFLDDAQISRLVHQGSLIYVLDAADALPGWVPVKDMLMDAVSKLRQQTMGLYNFEGTLEDELESACRQIVDKIEEPHPLYPLLQAWKQADAQMAWTRLAQISNALGLPMSVRLHATTLVPETFLKFLHLHRFHTSNPMFPMFEHCPVLWDKIGGHMGCVIDAIEHEQQVLAAAKAEAAARRRASIEAKQAELAAKDAEAERLALEAEAEPVADVVAA